ncbi:MAG: flagellar biosynthesis regulator FlaF [Desulfobacterales bacterium]
MYPAALKTYDQVRRTTQNGRELEAEVLSKAAHRLQHCRDHWPDIQGGGRLHEALKYNQRIWTILQAELEKPENPLPQELKRNLLRLSLFIDRRTLEILADPRPEKLSILIEINRNIAAGLRSRLLSEKAAAA